MDFAMAMNYIEDKNKLGSVLGLGNITELLKRLGNPQDKISCLHIAGTNGKGSVFSFVQEILLEAGFKVGRYISPTIFTYLERFQINQNYMPETCFLALFEKVIKIVEEIEKEGVGNPTAFEIETAIAFLYFEQEKVDYALIECGMGGRLDATNVIAKPVETVFAQISMDHMQFLGETLEKIAIEKSGIIRQNSIVVSAPQEEEVLNVLKQVAKEKESAFFFVDSSDIVIKKNTVGNCFSYKNMDEKDYEITLLGDHQIRNAATAILAVHQLDAYKNGKISEKHIRDGLYKTRWLGRLTKVMDNPVMYVDGAHNEAAWIALKASINKYFTNRPIIYIIGVLKDKEYEKMADILAPTMTAAIAITPNNERGLAKEELAVVLQNRGVSVELADTKEEARKKAYLCAKKHDNAIILVSGSLSFIADYMNVESF